jgi:hypothetical protein
MLLSQTTVPRFVLPFRSVRGEGRTGVVRAWFT